MDGAVHLEAPALDRCREDAGENGELASDGGRGEVVVIFQRPGHAAVGEAEVLGRELVHRLAEGGGEALGEQAQEARIVVPDFFLSSLALSESTSAM